MVDKFRFHIFPLILPILLILFWVSLDGEDRCWQSHMRVFLLRFCLCTSSVTELLWKLTTMCCLICSVPCSSRSLLTTERTSVRFSCSVLCPILGWKGVVFCSPGAVSGVGKAATSLGWVLENTMVLPVQLVNNCFLPNSNHWLGTRAVAREFRVWKPTMRSSGIMVIPPRRPFDPGDGRTLRPTWRCDCFKIGHRGISLKILSL